VTRRPACRTVPAREQEGQAAVELALVLPLLVVLLLAIVQVGLVVRDEVLVIHAARSAAREAALGSGPRQVAAAAQAASGLRPERLQVRSATFGREVAVTVSYRSVAIVPIVNRLMPDVRLEETCRLALEVSSSPARQRPAPRQPEGTASSSSESYV